MAAQGKKGKVKWKPVSADILIDSSRKSLTWADELDELDRDIPHALDTKPTKVELPTAPRASRASAIDESKIPYTGPFQAYISNVPYDLNEDELINFFQDLKVKSVRLPREERSGNRAKGFGYIEFEDRTSLSAALSRGDTMLKGRSIHIELATNSDRQGGQRGRRDGGRDQNSSDRTTGNWRSGPRQEDNEERGGGGFDRGGHGGRRDYGGGGGGSGLSRGGFDREERGFNRGGGFDREDRGGGGGSFHREDRDNRGGGGGFDRYDRGGRDDRRDDRGFGDRDRHDRDNRDRGFGGRDRDGGGGGGFGGYSDRGGGGGFRDKDRGFGRDEERGGGGGGGSSSGHWRDEPRENRGFGGNRGFDDRNRDRDSKFGPPRREPQDTQLPERSRATESGTRPKIVLQPRTKPIEPATSDGASTASASIFGGAKPVDTAAREREIEERLMRSTDDFSEARGGKSGPGSTGSRGEKQQWTDEKRVEPAPPPKENAWARKPPANVVNNGRSTPEDERSQSQQSGGAHDSSDEPSSEPKRTEETRRGGGAVPSRSTSGTSDRSRGKESDRQCSKHRERKESGDDLLKMPKMQESRPPNFAGSNKYSSLVDSDEAPNE